MTDAQWHSPRKPETRSGENSYKRSSVKPCFETVILGTQNLINNSLGYMENVCYIKYMG